MKIDDLNIDLIAVGLALKGENQGKALRTGIQDGFEQGFELSMGMSYDDMDCQTAYDTGTYIGACVAVWDEKT